MRQQVTEVYPNISIHAPLRGRPKLQQKKLKVPLFQSTPPCGGDQFLRWPAPSRQNFNPRPLAGATLSRPGFDCRIAISIHAPLRGRPAIPYRPIVDRVFQSTPPCGGDYFETIRGPGRRISIHAPLRGRLFIKHRFPGHVQFQSTPPCGGDVRSIMVLISSLISIHAPLRGRPAVWIDWQTFIKISIHAPLRGRRRRPGKSKGRHYFNPRPLAGATFCVLFRWKALFDFNPRPLAGATLLM